MFLTTTARRSWWIVSNLKSSHQSPKNLSENDFHCNQRNYLHEYKGKDQSWTLYCTDIVDSIAELVPTCCTQKQGQEPNDAMVVKVSSQSSIARPVASRHAQPKRVLNFVMSVPNLIPASRCGSLWKTHSGCINIAY